MMSHLVRNVNFISLRALTTFFELAEDVEAGSGQITDIFLPSWFADRIPLFFTPLLASGLLGLLAQRWRGETSECATTH
jgi:hypothetical protein